jgi:uncharacterized protein YbcV (DUF1398 family)
MFTLEQIKNAHSKVKSGADFPAYAQEIKKLGLLRYEHFVADGHTQYFGADTFTLKAPTKWETKDISISALPQDFERALKHHQGGGSDYLTFCEQAAQMGVYKWVVDLVAMACIYYDTEGNVILKEEIPVHI